MKRLKKITVIIGILIVIFAMPLTTVYAEPEDGIEEVETFAPEPETYEPETFEPETYEPETQAPETYEPETQAPETYEPETQAPQTQEPVTEAPATEPETAPVETYEQETQPVTYNHNINQLPTLVDSTQVAAETPKAIGADSESGGVSFVGGVVSWICIGIAVAVILAFLLSTTGKGKSGIGRYDSGNKLGGNRYNGNMRY